MRFWDVATTSDAVGTEPSRSAKRDLLAGLLERCDPDEVTAVVGFLIGDPRQGRTGVGWRTLQKAEEGLTPAAEPSLTVGDVDRALIDLAGLVGPGSTARRHDLLVGLFAAATADESRFLVRLFGGDLRQGALAGVMTDAVARAADVPATVVRRAVMLGGRLDAIATVALTEGRTGLEAVGLSVGRALQPMLASTAATATEAVEDLGPSAVEWKLDGIRVQVHRDGDDVAVFTRNLNEITERMPGVVAVALGLPATSFVLDGEALVLDDHGRPAMFQDTASRVGADGGWTSEPRPFFFDLLHLDGEDLLDRPLEERRRLLHELAGAWQVPGEITDDPAEAERVLAAALEAGHEGVVAKGATSLYEAGRRGKAWRKVKPVHTLDLVVLGVEWGYGRRQGWLSNLHLGARASTQDGDDGTEAGFVMVGKTFKGLTDDLLRWQTDRFLDLASTFEHGPEARHGVVTVRPEQVVEIAVDGVQRSTRYPGGVALRFARVLRYRHDKTPAEADTIDAVRALLPSGPSDQRDTPDGDDDG
jgi:DNA ligase-1